MTRLASWQARQLDELLDRDTSGTERLQGAVSAAAFAANLPPDVLLTDIPPDAAEVLVERRLIRQLLTALLATAARATRPPQPARTSPGGRLKLTVRLAKGILTIRLTNRSTSQREEQTRSTAPEEPAHVPPQLRGIRSLAEAAGGQLHTHAQDRTLVVEARIPVSPGHRPGTPEELQRDSSMRSAPSVSLSSFSARSSVEA